MRAGRRSSGAQGRERHLRTAPVSGHAARLQQRHHTAIRRGSGQARLVPDDCLLQGSCALGELLSRFRPCSSPRHLSRARDPQVAPVTVRRQVTASCVWGGARACGVDVVGDSAIWRWDGQVWRSTPGPPLLPREDALLVSDPEGASLTLIGGRRGGRAYADVWRFDGKTWREIPASGGPGAIEHGFGSIRSQAKAHRGLRWRSRPGLQHEDV